MNMIMQIIRRLFCRKSNVPRAAVFTGNAIYDYEPEDPGPDKYPEPKLGPEPSSQQH